MKLQAWLEALMIVGGEGDVAAFSTNSRLELVSVTNLVQLTNLIKITHLLAKLYYKD